jgi:glutaredoxin
MMNRANNQHDGFDQLPRQPGARLGLPHAWVAALLIASAPLALAQYKIVGPDGRVTFSDRPVAAANASIQPLSTRRGSGPSLANLPYELVQVATRYPAFLYTTPKGCSACDQARQMLRSRGIPFAERTVSSDEDIEELKKQTGNAELPVLKVGGQLLKGYASVEWTNLLDVAGYPNESKLPASYAFAPASPLTEPKVAAKKVDEPKPVSQTSLEPNAGTAGIRF